MRLKPDLAVIDITMPLLNGIDAVIQMKKRLRGVKVIFVTMHMNPAYLDAALAAGATGYVLKTAAREELLAAVESVVGGRTYLTQGLPRAHPANIPTRPDNPARLSPRERETLQLIAQGKASKEIAGILNISVRTVDFHRENLKRKLKLKTIADLTRHAIELDLA
jgi:DNA-binding NarL/FixJ family response regulator